MKKNNIKNNIVISFKIVMLLFIVIFVSMSIFNIINQDKIANYQLQEKVFNKNPNIQLSLERIESIKENQNNFYLDYIKPKYTFLIKTNDKLGGYKIEFQRGFFQELNINKLESYTLDDSQSFEDRLTQIKQSKLQAEFKTEKSGNVKYEGQKHTESYRQIGGFDLKEQYFDGLVGNEENRKWGGWKIFDYKNLKINLTPDQYLKNTSPKLKIDYLLGSKIEKFYDKPEAISVLDDSEYPNCIYFIMEFDKGFGGEVTKKDSYLKALRVVKKDRSYVEIPPKADGTFDFESIKDKLK